MANVIKGLVEYEWPDHELPQFSEAQAAVKEFNIQETLDLPPSKPDIEQLIKVKSDIAILSTRVIKTPIGQSLERQTLTGWKLIVEGELEQVIRYVADEPTQSVHATHFNVPFSTFIVLPPDFNETQCITLETYYEDVFTAQVGERRIFKNTTILIVAQIA